MKIRTLLSVALSIAALAAPVPLLAQEDGQSAVARWQADPTTIFDSTEVDLDEFLWIARPVVVFGDAPQQPAFQDQMDLIARRIDDLARRDVVVVTDSDPDAGSEIRTALRPRGFQMTLIGKDGEVKLRKPSPWSVREISRSIDKMPMRQREIRDGGS